ncbi:MAG TPA: hypoxanthine phosphoribosyltransferase [Eubacteriales bacterium]|nr:hypoxanthine phosphoribosyltransferase [Eubacteriales bacterium]
MEKHNDILHILIDRETLSKRVDEMGKQISKDFAGKRPLIISILKGSWIFLADLIRAMDIDADVDFMAISSYGSGTNSTGEIKLIMDLNRSVKGRDVLIVEDIIDSGLTMDYMLKLLKARGANTVTIATLLSKPSRRKIQIPIDYVGFEIEDKFVIGYGLDFDEKFRGLKDIAVLRPEAYQN